MAFCVSLSKIREDEGTADYAFTDGATQNHGVVRLDKRTGVSELISPLPGDAEEHVLRRARRKLYLHWQCGEFPEKTVWAS